MFQFIATNILMLSLGAMLYLAARALPRVGEEETERKGGFFERLIKSGKPERLDAMFSSFMVKFLRKVKVHLLKLENLVTARLKNMSQENSSPFAGNGNGESSPVSFKDILEEKQESGNKQEAGGRE